ncbi:hypothetical protein MA16_Dca028265 [Dendrobium catenatum]|uniref:Uncharacterized protein n=1 Tax=Dendrobium catenatum TaxID=906689 RepID=A0A2I0V8Z3_9ASPA|nr:hypothetical protein MA16_Dca028265 [Dendrobium catenatum]
MIRGGSGFTDERPARRKFFCGGGRVTDHYGRHFEQEECVITEGGGQKPPLRTPIRGGIGFSGGGTAGRECHSRGGEVADHYGRSFGQASG